MPNPRTVVDTVAIKFSDNEILQRVAEKLDDGSMAWKVDIVGGLSISVGDINIGAVNILNAADVQINPATEETLAAFKASFDARDLATETTLLAFKVAFDVRDLATETTLVAFKTAFDSRDLATETTLVAFKTAFDARDLATHAEQLLQTTRLVSIDTLLQGQVSAGNSSVAPLGIGATFTGAFEDVKDFAFLTLSVFADVASAANGLVFEWSHGGVSVDRAESTLVLAGSGRAFALAPRARYFRVRYINGGSAQATFRLGVVYHRSGTGLITKPIKDTVTEENFAQLVQATLLGRRADGSYIQAGSEMILGSSHLIVAATNIEARLAENNQMFFSNGEVNLPNNGTETPFLLVRNPIGSGRNIRLNEFRPIVLNVGSASVVFRMYSKPTVTATGTPGPITSYRISAVPPVSAMQVFTVPTIAANGTKFAHSFAGVGTNAFMHNIDFDLAVILEPGQDLLVTGRPDANNVLVSAMLDWAEVP